jgi:hypothetical protein
MKLFLRVFIFFTFIPAALFYNACAVQGSLGYQLTITNVIQPNVNITNFYAVIELVKYTNLSIITNHIQITNDGYILQGNIYITNTFNEQTVQPTFKIMGTIDGDIVNFIPDGNASLNVTVTNSGFITNGKVSTPTPGKKAWEAVVFQQAAPYIFVKVSANLTGIGSYSMALNFRVKNSPYITYDKKFDGIVTNVASVDLSGKSYVTAPDTVSKVVIYQVTSLGATNDIRTCSLGPNVTGWTNSINSKTWTENFSLVYGMNYFYLHGISSVNITNSYPSFMINRALIGVDGIKEAKWNSAPLMGQSLVATLNGYQLSDFRMTNDANNLYFWIGAGSLPVPPSDYNGVRIALTLDTKGDSSGVSKDAWGGVFVFNPTNNFLPDYQVQFRIQTGGGQAVYQASGTNWINIANNWGGSMNGVQMSVIRTNGFEIAVPLSFFNLTAGSKVRAIVTLSGIDGDNGNKQVWDAIPECSLNPTVTNVNQLNPTYLGAYCPPYTVQ